MLEPGVKTGNGKATFKTATAAANAAREACDAAKATEETCRSHAAIAEKSAKLSKLCLESMHNLQRMSFKWDVFILVVLFANMIFSIFVWLRT